MTPPYRPTPIRKVRHRTSSSESLEPPIASSAQADSASASPPYSHCRLSRPTKRRSSFLAECMLKEKIRMHPTGFDDNGWPSFELCLAESQGFRWNHHIYEVPDESAVEDILD